MKIQRLIAGAFLVIFTCFNLPVANAEEIPVLIWERGQVQNVVLGQGNSDQNWKLFLKNQGGNRFQLSKSLTNKDGFLVYSIDLPTNFPIGGYVVVAQNQSGDIKEVAGIQVVSTTSKVITRVPIELFLILFGFSILIYFLNQARNLSRPFAILSEQPISIGSNFDKFPRRVRSWFEQGSKTSLFKMVALDDLKIDIKFPVVSNLIGLVGIILLSMLQFTTGNWTIGNKLLILICLICGSAFLSYGIVTAALSTSYLLLNIAMAKTLADILAIFILSSVFVLPAIYNQFLFKLFDSILPAWKSRFWVVSIFSGCFAGLAYYQLLLVYESLNSFGNSLNIPTQILLISMCGIFTLKNYLMKNALVENQTFEIVRSIGPFFSLIVSIFVSAVIYIWTYNIVITVVGFITTLLTLATNWIKLGTINRFTLPTIDFFFGLVIVPIVILAVYFSTRVLPLDVINRSHLAVLIVFPLDLILAIYLWISNATVERSAIS